MRGKFEPAPNLLRAMNRSKIWTYLKIAIYSVVAQLVAIVLGIFSAGAGHGSYVAARLLFPYTILSFGIHGPIPDAFIVLACTQYLLYGFIWGMAIKYKNVAPAMFVLALVHLCAVLLAFIFYDSSGPRLH